jgi:hypothetical protein
MTVVPRQPYFSLFLQSKIKLKGRHFDTTEVVEAESLAVLNILKEHNFMHLKMAEALGSVHTRVRGYFEGMVASSPEVSF